MTDLIDCDLLTGFLGSGKTTLLNAWLRAPQSSGTAVLVNEVGDIGIDQLILAEVADNVMLLESGCLCCTLSGSLRETLLDLCARARAAGLPLTRIVVETTGLAEPAPILHTLLGDRVLAETVRLNQVVVTVDAVQGMRQLSSQPESARQLAAAEVAVITKPDMADDPVVAALRQEIARLNPLAAVVESTDGDAAVAVFTRRGGERQWDALRAERDAERDADADHNHCNDHDHDHDHGQGHGHDHNPVHGHDPDHGHDHGPEHAGHGAHAGVSTQSFYFDFATTWAGVAAWWHLVSGHYGDALLRGKGLLQLRDADPATGARQIYLQTVGKVFHRPQPVAQWPDADPRSRLVCIGSGLDHDWLRRSLDALRIDEPGVLPNTLADLDTLIPPDMEKH